MTSSGHTVFCSGLGSREFIRSPRISEPNPGLSPSGPVLSPIIIALSNRVWGDDIGCSKVIKGDDAVGSGDPSAEANFVDGWGLVENVGCGK